jgi:hypothetical protein
MDKDDIATEQEVRNQFENDLLHYYFYYRTNKCRNIIE